MQGVEYLEKEVSNLKFFAFLGIHPHLKFNARRFYLCRCATST
jgi:hypothetical protein